MNDEELIRYNQQLARLQSELNAGGLTGPRIQLEGQPSELAHQFRSTGASMTLSTRHIQLKAPIIRHDTYLFPEPLTDLYLHPDQLPFGIAATPWDAPDLNGIPLVSFTHAIRQIYGVADKPTPLPEFLRGFNPLVSVTSFGDPLHTYCLDFTSPMLAACGFAVARITAREHIVRVRFAWVFPKDRKVRPVVNYLAAGTLLLRTDSGDILSDGEWIDDLRSNQGLSPLLQEWLEDWCDDDFAKLFSETGRHRLEDKLFCAHGVKTPLRQAREKRVAFVREHAELWEDHNTLAKALRGAGLYSFKTGISDIIRSCSALIEEARV